MNILFLVSSYEPWLNSNTSCIKNIIDNKPSSLNVHIVANKHFCNIHDIKSSSSLTWIGKHKSKLGNIFEVIQSIFKSVSINNRLCNDYLDYLIENGSNYDHIVPVCFPFEALVASAIYADKVNYKVSITPIWYDEFAASDSAHRLDIIKKIKYKYNLNLEKKIIDNSQLVFGTKNIINRFFEKGISENKFRRLEHPLINKIPKENSIVCKNKVTTFIYAGNLSNSIRDGRYAFNFFSYLSKQNFNFNFKNYLYGSAYNQYSPYQNHNIDIKKPITKAILDTELDNANMLVVIGNNNINQEQGKVYEYISHRKPIIYFYKTSEEPIYCILKKYPLCFFINEEKDIDDYIIENFYNYVKINKDKLVSYNHIAQNFIEQTSEHVSEQFFNTLKDID